MLTHYLVFACPRCGSIRYAKEGQKAAGCFKCGLQVPLDQGKTRILLKARTAEEVVEAVKRYKEKEGFRTRLQR